MNIDELFHNPSTSLLLCFVWEYLRLYCCKSGLGILLWSLIISPDDSCKVLSKCSEVNTGVYSVSRKGGELHLILILPATSWDRVSRDYLRAQILVTVCLLCRKSAQVKCASVSEPEPRVGENHRSWTQSSESPTAVSSVETPCLDCFIRTPSTELISRFSTLTVFIQIRSPPHS